MSKITITKAYLAWLLISIVSWLIAWQTGQLWDLLSQVVDLSDIDSHGIARDDMIVGFIIVSLAYAILTSIILGIFVLLTNKQKVWAKYILTLLCLYQLVTEAFGHYSIITTYISQYMVYDYMLASASILCVIIMLIKPYSHS